MRQSSAPRSKARQRILDAAYDLFSRHGVRGVGIDAVVAHSGVARMTLYRHFGSKNALVLEFLRQREQKWTIGWLQREVEQRAATEAERLLAIFDVFNEWFHSDRFEGCSFINVLLESPDVGSPAHVASRECLANIRTFLETLAREAGIVEHEAFARKWHILMKGSIVAAQEGDLEAALRAQEMARLILQQALPIARADASLPR